MPTSSREFTGARLTRRRRTTHCDRLPCRKYCCRRSKRGVAMRLAAADDAFVFPSERMTPLSRDNWWNRVMRPALEKVGLEWATFQVMRRTHSTVMKQLKAD